MISQNGLGHKAKVGTVLRQDKINEGGGTDSGLVLHLISPGATVTLVSCTQGRSAAFGQARWVAICLGIAQDVPKKPVPWKTDIPAWRIWQLSFTYNILGKGDFWNL